MGHLPRVKICGITQLKDALLAAEFGASMVGFIFWPRSPRFIDPYHAQEIVSSLPPWLSPVGVFVDQSFEHVCSVASLVKLGAVQLHGNEGTEYCEKLPHRVIKAMQITKDRLDEVGRTSSSVTLLLDNHDPVWIGGTGRTIDWSAAAKISRRRKIILSGGLCPENVVEAIKKVRPCGVDVASGVEERPGVKDADRLEKFFKAVHEADT